MKSGNAKAEEARRRAHAQFAKPKAAETKGLTDYEKAKRATAAKTAKLRALRLEKEAADREATEKTAASAKPKKKAKSVQHDTAAEEDDEETDGEVEREIDEPRFGGDGGSDFDE